MTRWKSFSILADQLDLLKQLRHQTTYRWESPWPRTFAWIERRTRQLNRDDSVLVEPIICEQSTRRRLAESLVLFYTHMQRKSPDILNEQVTKTRQGKANRELGLLVRLAEELHEALCDNHPESVGKLLHRSWMIKRQIASGITDPRIDEWYKTALEAGAQGGKILGAGGGGFLLLYCEPEEQGRLVRRMEALGLRKIPVAFEGQGSRIIYVEE